MQYGAYILFSEKLGKYYVGYTTDIEKRLAHHNAAQNRFSKKGVPWTLILFIPCPDKISALFYITYFMLSACSEIRIARK